MTNFKVMFAITMSMFVNFNFMNAADPKPVAKDEAIAHMVYFKLKDSTPESKQKLLEGCKKYLSKHEGVIFFAAGLRGEEFKREVNDLDWDVGLHIVFANKAAHDKYQDHPDHTKFRDSIKDTITKVRVFDTVYNSGNPNREEKDPKVIPKETPKKPVSRLKEAQALQLTEKNPNLNVKLDAVNKSIDAELNDIVKLYQHLHANPELSLQEEKSAARMADELKKLEFEVTTKVGGHGVVGVFKNGVGPTIYVRADMDALPIVEKTGVPYASKARGKTKDGSDVGIMHACGHDIHMSCFVGTARTLIHNKSQWSGTLVFVAQPAEEIGVGARAMIADGLFKKFPKPDYCLALHAEPKLAAGMITFTEGLAMANVDTVDLIVKGKGGHGAAPHLTVDPIVLAAKIILDLQTIVSREVNPTDPTVVTVGSIHGGTKHNIIPNEVRLQITVRTTKDSVRDHVLKAIERIAKGCADAARAPVPEMIVHLDEFTPATINEPKLTRRITGLFRQILGEANVKERPPILGGEDFGRFAESGAPIFLYFLGTISQEKYEESMKPGAIALPGMHTDGYAPTPAASIKVGVRTMSMAVMELMPKK
jgi:amidohydrolase